MRWQERPRHKGGSRGYRPEGSEDVGQEFREGPDGPRLPEGWVHPRDWNRGPAGSGEMYRKPVSCVSSANGGPLARPSQDQSQQWLWFISCLRFQQSEEPPLDIPLSVETAGGRNQTTLSFGRSTVPSRRAKASKPQDYWDRSGNRIGTHQFPNLSDKSIPLMLETHARGWSVADHLRSSWGRKPGGSPLDQMPKGAEAKGNQERANRRPGWIIHRLCLCHIPWTSYLREGGTLGDRGSE